MKHTKTRINTTTKAALAAQKVAGVSVAELQSAMKGSSTALQKLGQMNREGKMVSALMPAIVETVKTNIQNNKDWNQFLGDFVQQGSTTEVAIQSSQNKASLANAQYVHGMQEMSEQFKAAWEMEKGRHAWAIDYNRAKLFADMLFQQVEGQVRVLDQGSRIGLKQLQENDAYQLKSAQHLLEYGEEADLSLIHKRDYVEEIKGPGSLFKRFRNALGI